MSFRKKIQNPKHKDYFVQLWDRCTCLSISPSEKLFPNLTCPVTKELIDALVYYVGRVEQKKEMFQLAALAGGNPIKNLR